MRPKALLFDNPSGLLTPVYLAVIASLLLVLLRQAGLFALNFCTRPPRVGACPPLLANLEGTLSVDGLLGSIDRKAPSCPTSPASGAPKFEWPPTSMRIGS